MFYPTCRCASGCCSRPKRLRTFLQREGAALNSALRIFLRVIEHSLHRYCPGAAKLDKALVHIGAVAFIHRFSYDTT